MQHEEMAGFQKQHAFGVAPEHLAPNLGQRALMVGAFMLDHYLGEPLSRTQRVQAAWETMDSRLRDIEPLGERYHTEREDDENNADYLQFHQVETLLGSISQAAYTIIDLSNTHNTVGHLGARNRMFDDLTELNCQTHLNQGVIDRLSELHHLPDGEAASVVVARALYDQIFSLAQRTVLRVGIKDTTEILRQCLGELRLSSEERGAIWMYMIGGLKQLESQR